MNFGSLFAGIGGLDLGLERAGMTCKWQVEIDDYATKVLEKHWPTVPKYRDVRSFPPRPVSEWNRHKWKEEFGVDLICGGFPCQDISYAGKGAGLSGSRSGLFFEFIRVVRTLGPRYVLLENVAALLSRGIAEVLGTLASIGYDAEWHCIPAAAVGAPHIRDRVFVIAYRDGGKRNVADSDGTRLEEWQGKDTSGARTICRAKPERSDWWTTEPDVGRVAHGIPHRVDRLRCLGNAVVPQVAEWIGRRIMERT